MKADLVLDMLDDFRRRVADQHSDHRWISAQAHDREFRALRRRVEIEAAKEALPKEGG